jgi:ribokinase
MRTAVVGHVEWTEFAEVERVPRPGEIVRARSTFLEPAGGGSVAAVQLARLAGDCTFYTALGDDDAAARVRARLEQLGVRVEAVVRAGEPTRRSFTYLDDGHERTITVIGKRLQPNRSDDLPWDELREVGAVYFCAGDADALRAARQARALVATARVLPTLKEARVELDAVVGSANDPSERYAAGDIDPPPHLAVHTRGAEGGRWVGAEGRTGHWSAAKVPGPRVDAYGCGDSFAAGLAFALGDGRAVPDALELAARCGATCMSGRGPYASQLGS